MRLSGQARQAGRAPLTSQPTFAGVPLDGVAKEMNLGKPVRSTVKPGRACGIRTRDLRLERAVS